MNTYVIPVSEVLLEDCRHFSRSCFARIWKAATSIGGYLGTIGYLSSWFAASCGTMIARSCRRSII